jgi:superfamily II DNA/RNA helicase
MCCAQTGSGKTAAFLIPTIAIMMKNKASSIGDMTTPYQGMCKPDSLVMTSTRELCLQIHEESLKFCHRTGYRCCVVYGGAPTRGQMEDLAKGCDLMVATPGCLNDFINRGIIEVKETYVLVLDEADRMLDMGFEKQMREIVVDHGMPAKEDRQTLMFSATFPTECQTMAQDFLYNYIWIGVGIIGGAVTTVAQTLKQVVPKDKYTKLIEELDRFYETRNNSQRCLIFVNAKDTAKWLDEQLYDLHYDVGALHGNLTQQERETNLQRYRKGEIDVMVATDVAARGLDIEKVDLVVNYDLPNDIDTYVHRIGRSGRIGNKGAAVTFVSQDENGQFLDKMDVLQGLLTKMRDAGSAIPSWLEDQAQGNDTWDSKKDSWANWGGKDMRSSNGW